jgi:hypothetical protein
MTQVLVSLAPVSACPALITASRRRASLRFHGILRSQRPQHTPAEVERILI